MQAAHVTATAPLRWFFFIAGYDLDPPRIGQPVARLMRMAESGKLRPMRAAVLAQIAVAIEILLMAPIRIRNLIAIELDRHLVHSARVRGWLQPTEREYRRMSRGSPAPH